MTKNLSALLTSLACALALLGWGCNGTTGNTGGSGGIATGGSGGTTGVCNEDGNTNDGETGVDCGGPNCDPCQNGQACVFDLDCQAKICSGGVCGQPYCDDMRTNGDESDVDCGGSDNKSDGKACPLCDDNKHCQGPANCKSNVCRVGVCLMEACGDSFKNGDETDVDCGGSCGGCTGGKVCKGNGDCQDANCSSGVCISGTCQDGVLNQGEVGTDCGGPCVPCVDGVPCKADGDCESKHCDGTCQTPTCTDGKANGDETDVDCGGTCGPCADKLHCIWDVDCTSLACSPDPDNLGQKICTVPTCTDSQANGQETGLDCGGPTDCPACPDGQGCKVGNDCKSKVCANNTCQVPSCTDAAQNGTETATDCGGKTCVGCGAGLPCNVGGDCYSTVCTPDTHTCTQASCGDHIKNADETGTDCGGVVSGCLPCGKGQFCLRNTDCATRWCNPKTTKCDDIVCGDGIVQPGESCDDGNRQDLDNCTNDCKIATCGDGKVEKYTTFEYSKRTFPTQKFTNPWGAMAYLANSGTGCKQGSGCELWGVPTAPEHGLCQQLGWGVAFSVDYNSGQGASQATQLHINNWKCQAIDTCGAGINATNEVCFQSGCMLKVIDCRGEQCDNGAANDDHRPDACRSNCLNHFCGDNTVDSGEACDDGANNGANGDKCSTDCQLQ